MGGVEGGEGEDGDGAAEGGSHAFYAGFVHALEVAQCSAEDSCPDCSQGRILVLCVLHLRRGRCEWGKTSHSALSLRMIPRCVRDVSSQFYHAWCGEIRVLEEDEGGREGRGEEASAYVVVVLFVGAECAGEAFVGVLFGFGDGDGVGSA